ncbi:MAG: beta-ketoacyl synthase N-terminal-like domain-containing protein [Planctomycetota bacterium]
MSAPNNDVVVTGLGPVTAVGVGCEALWAALSAGRSNVTSRKLGIGIGQLVDMPMAAMPPAADVPGLEPHLKTLAEQDCPSYRDMAYALLAVESAMTDAGLRYDREANNLGAIQAFEAPGLERTVSRLLELLAGPPPTDGPPPVYDMLAPYFYSSQAFLYVHVMGKALGFHGFSTSVHNACSSGAFALEVAAQRIRTGQADVMVVVGGEAFDTAVRLEWFRRLDLYAREARMRPFDDEPSGFYVGEGAAALVLESAAHAAKRGATPYAAYLGGAFAHQAAKQTTPDVRAGRLSTVIAGALKAARLAPRDVDLVVPHGASTALSDGYEAACLAQALGGACEHAVATVFKPYVGHLLAASSLIETICALLAMKHQCVPATLHTRRDHATLAVPLVTTQTRRPVETVLKLSTGFTGHDAASVFRRV